MLGFKRFGKAHKLIAGIETMHMCVFRSIVTDRFGIVTAEFGNVTDRFGDVTGEVLKAA